MRTRRLPGSKEVTKSDLTQVSCCGRASILSVRTLALTILCAESDSLVESENFIFRIARVRGKAQRSRGEHRPATAGFEKRPSNSATASAFECRSIRIPKFAARGQSGWSQLSSLRAKGTVENVDLSRSHRSGNYEHAIYHLRLDRAHRFRRAKRARTDLSETRVGGARPRGNLAAHSRGHDRSHAAAWNSPQGRRGDRDYQSARDHRRLEPQDRCCGL